MSLFPFSCCLFGGILYRLVCLVSHSLVLIVVLCFLSLSRFHFSLIIYFYILHISEHLLEHFLSLVNPFFCKI